MAIPPTTTAAPNSIGLQLIRAIVNAGSRQTVAQVNAEWFTPEERPAWNAFTLHYRLQGTLASVQTMLELGFRLPQAAEPPGYYMGRLNARAVYNTILTEQPELAEAMRNRDASAAAEVVQRMARMTLALGVTQDTTGLVEEFDRVWEDFQAAAQNPGIQGVTLGWSYLDQITGGLEPGDVGVLVGRPGMGKSWLMAHASYMAWQAGHSVLFVTNEMTSRQIARRLMGILAGVNPNLIRRGQLSQWARDIVVQRVDEARTGAPFHLISGNFKKTVPAVDAAIQQFTPDIVYIDASYLMRPEGNSSGKARWELLADVGRGIKDMAQARNRPILHSVQFNREAAKLRQGARQDTSMIGGTDEVGQIASLVIGIGKGPANREETQRTLSLVKVRESEMPTNPILINFLFDPPDFSYIPTDDQGQPVVGQQPAQGGELDEWGEP